MLSGNGIPPLGRGGYYGAFRPLRAGNFEVLVASENVGYNSSVGLPSSNYGVDVYAKLQRCAATARALDRRLAQDPGWAGAPPASTPAIG